MPWASEVAGWAARVLAGHPHAMSSVDRAYELMHQQEESE